MNEMPITKKGFAIILAGVAVMVLGYILMMGGGSADPQVFNYSMFNAQRLVLAPIAIIAGVILVIVGIMGSSRKSDKE